MHAVTDFSSFDASPQLPRGQYHELQLLRRLEGRRRHRVDARSHEEVCASRVPRGFRVHHEQWMPSRGSIARFFEELARGRKLARLSWLDHPRGELQALNAAAMAILAHQNSVAIVRQREDSCPVRPLDEMKFFDDVPVRELDALLVNLQPASVDELSLLEHLPSTVGVHRLLVPGLPPIRWQGC